ncbi:hypothetical protein chiPu_0033504, partial [Chiloscyllium punctatum]|nr:hypothetical protein [Chiloscyllium punctatum]
RCDDALAGRALRDDGVDFGARRRSIACRTHVAWDRCGRCDDVGAIDRRRRGGRIGERLVEVLGRAGRGLRIGAADRLTGLQRGDLCGRRLLRRGRFVAPEAAGIDDVGGRLRRGVLGGLHHLHRRLGLWRRNELRVGGGELDRGGELRLGARQRNRIGGFGIRRLGGSRGRNHRV